MPGRFPFTIDGLHQRVKTNRGTAGVIPLQIFTTRPTTGLTKGDLMLLFHNSTPKFGVCTSTAAQTIKLIRLKTKTFGRLTA